MNGSPSLRLCGSVGICGSSPYSISLQRGNVARSHKYQSANFENEYICVVKLGFHAEQILGEKYKRLIVPIRNIHVNVTKWASEMRTADFPVSYHSLYLAPNYQLHIWTKGPIVPRVPTLKLFPEEFIRKEYSSFFCNSPAFVCNTTRPVRFGLWPSFYVLSVHTMVSPTWAREKCSSVSGGGVRGRGWVECGREGARAGAGSFECSALQPDWDEGTFSLLTERTLFLLI